MLYTNPILTYRTDIQYTANRHPPRKPSTAAAAGSIACCALVAGGVAVMQPFLASIGEGPFFTLVAGVIIVLGLVAISIIRNKGMGWWLRREARRVAVG
jgi:hypothetical protein